MSYILEALQKSEHARQRGKVPDLSTVPETTASLHGGTAPPRPPYAVAAYALTLAAAVLGWWRPWQAPDHGPAVPRPVVPSSGVTAADGAGQPAAAIPPARQGQGAGVPGGPERSLPPQAPRAPAAAPVPAAPVADARPVAEPAERPPRTPESRPVRGAEERAPKPPDAAPSRPQPDAAATADAPVGVAAPGAGLEPSPPAPAPQRAQAGRILELHELPPAVRSSLPRLVISGYASAPESGTRIVVINDKLVQEGEEVEPGVRLLTVAGDGLVFDFRGYRFRAQR